MNYRIIGKVYLQNKSQKHSKTNTLTLAGLCTDWGREYRWRIRQKACLYKKMRSVHDFTDLHVQFGQPHSDNVCYPNIQRIQETLLEHLFNKKSSAGW